MSSEYYTERLAGCELTVFGNIMKIRQNLSETLREKDREHVRSEVEASLRSMKRLQVDFDEALEDHVLKYGQDFNDYPVKGFENYDEIDLDLKPNPPTRQNGDITKLSRSARLRLLNKLNQINEDYISQYFHLVLTYPKEFPTVGKIHKSDLDAFLKRCKRKFSDNIEYLWKLEFQERGAPHYHILLHLPKPYPIKSLRKWFSKNWYEVAQRFWEEKIENHLDAGIRLDKADSVKNAGFYLSKYISKNEEDIPPNQGRFWGCSRNWGEVVLGRVELTKEQLIHLRRLVKRKLKGNKRMQKLSTIPMNFVFYGHWSFFTMAIDWVKEMH